MATTPADAQAVAANEPALATEDTKLEVLEDDDEFEEFETEDWDDEVGEAEATQIWEDDWDDDDVSDDFSQQLKAELDRVAQS